MKSIYDFERPFVSTDAVILRVTYTEAMNYRKVAVPKLQVLMYKRDVEPCKDMWCLPGGFVGSTETLEENITRVLKDKMNISSCFLNQLHTFSTIRRDERGRVISVAFIGTSKRLEDTEGTWVDLEIDHNTVELTGISKQDIGFDHYDMLVKAVEYIRKGIDSGGMLFELVPEKFRLAELELVYELLQGKTEFTPNFRRKFADYVVETEEYAEAKGHRPAKLYKRKK